MLKEINKRIILISVFLGIVAFALDFFITDYSMLNALIGVAAGMLLSIVRFLMLDRSIKKITEYDPDAAKKLGMGGYITRYILTAICLIVAILYSLETFVAMFVTVILTTQLAARTVKVSDEEGGKN